MLFLRENIIAHTFDLRLADRERTVSALPIKIRDAVVLHPFRTLALDIADENREIGTAKRDQYVNVIPRSARDDHLGRCCS